jgi:general secretion pathway protein J
MIRTESGFTLLELLVAMTLAALLSVVLFSGLHFGRKAWETTQSATASINDIRRLQEFLGSALARAYPARAGNATLSHVDFSGDAQDLRFLAPDPQNDGAWDYVAVSATEDATVIRVTPELSDGASSDSVRTVRGTLALSYYGTKKGAQRPHWYGRWQNEPRLPDLVRVEVTEGHRLVSATDVALRVDAPADCVLNLLTHDCQER